MNEPTITAVPPVLSDYHDGDRQTVWEHFLFPIRNIPVKRLASQVNGKTILVTGASFGIGAALADCLSHFQTTLILTGRSMDKLEHLRHQYENRNVRILIHPLDLREESSIQALLHFLQEQQLSIDIYVNNAGKSIQRGLRQSMDRFTDTQRCSRTNYTGPVQLLLGLLPGLIQRSGQIINVSALNVLLPPTAGWSAYQSSKAAFDQWLRCMEPELKVSGVAVSTTYLPLVRTRMSMVNPKNSNRTAMSKAKAVRVIARCIISRKRKFRPWWTGIVLFFCWLFPNGWYRLQVCILKKQQ